MYIVSEKYFIFNYELESEKCKKKYLRRWFKKNDFTARKSFGMDVSLLKQLITIDFSHWGRS